MSDTSAEGVAPDPVAEPQVEAPVAEAAPAVAVSPAVPPAAPQPIPGGCGWCGSGETETQNHSVLCLYCGKWSDMNGNRIEGNPHHYANVSVTFPWANNL